MASIEDTVKENVDGKFYVDHQCIDCDLCVPECPEDAIFVEDEVPADQIHFIEINKKYAQIWPEIDAPKEPLLDGSTEIVE